MATRQCPPTQFLDRGDERWATHEAQLVTVLLNQPLERTQMVAPECLTDAPLGFLRRAPVGKLAQPHLKPSAGSREYQTSRFRISANPAIASR